MPGSSRWGQLRWTWVRIRSVVASLATLVGDGGHGSMMAMAVDRDGRIGLIVTCRSRPGMPGWLWYAWSVTALAASVRRVWMRYPPGNCRRCAVSAVPSIRRRCRRYVVGRRCHVVGVVGVVDTSPVLSRSSSASSARSGGPPPASSPRSEPRRATGKRAVRLATTGRRLAALSSVGAHDQGAFLLRRAMPPPGPPLADRTPYGRSLLILTGGGEDPDSQAVRLAAFRPRAQDHAAGALTGGSTIER
jgi:hypothetical protein